MDLNDCCLVPSFYRLLDGAPWKTASHALALEVLIPLGDDYERLQEAACILRSAEATGRAIIRMAEGHWLYEELTLYLQIEKYIINPKADQATPSLKRILTDRMRKTGNAGCAWSNSSAI